MDPALERPSNTLLVDKGPEAQRGKVAFPCYTIRCPTESRCCLWSGALSIHAFSLALIAQLILR